MDAETWMTADEAAAALRVHRSTVYRRRARLQAEETLGVIRIPRAVVMAIVERAQSSAPAGAQNTAGA